LKLRDTLFALRQAADAEEIVLFVDEVVRSKKPKDILTELTSTMDSFQLPDDPPTKSRVSVFVSSLDGILPGVNSTPTGFALLFFLLILRSSRLLDRTSFDSRI
jgi:hypothetical protein